MRAVMAIALAGTSTTASAQFTVEVAANDTRVAVGETITWTITVTGGIDDDGEFLQAYDLNIVASDETLGIASAFETALSPLVGPNGGTPSGASLIGVFGGQSPIIDPFGTTYGSPITIGSFQVVAEHVGNLTYSFTDGGALTTDHFRSRVDCLCPLSYDGAPEVLVVDTVTIIPAPSSAALIALTAIAAPRRRR